MSSEKYYFMQISPTKRLLLNEYLKCKLLMAQTILMASYFNTLDLNYFRNKIVNEELKQILFGNGVESRERVIKFFEELNIDELTFDEKLALKCFERKFRFLEEKDSALIWKDTEEFLKRERENLSEEVLRYYGYGLSSSLGSDSSGGGGEGAIVTEVGEL